MMHAAPDPACLLALGLTTLLAFGGGQSDDACAGLRLPVWLPLAGLAALAGACGVLGVSDPETFAAAFGSI